MYKLKQNRETILSNRFCNKDKNVKSDYKTDSNRKPTGLVVLYAATKH